MGRLVGDLKERTLRFGVSTINAIKQLPHEASGWIIAKQFGRAATSIGANVWEADAALTDSDFAYKISVARKEASEAQYWLALCRETKLLSIDRCDRLSNEATELVKILTTIVRRTQEHIRATKAK